MIKRQNSLSLIAGTRTQWGKFFLVWMFLAIGISSCAKSYEPIPNPPVSTLRVAMDNNYPPYAFLDSQGNMQGILVDQWSLWEERTGVKVEIVGLPWEDALSRMKKGEFDVIDTIFYTDERAQVFDFTDAYADIDVRIFFPSNVSGLADADSLRGFRVAVKSGDANAEYLLDHGVTDLSYYNSYEEIIKAAKNKRETIFVIDQPPALYFLYKYNLLDSFSYSDPLYGGEFHRAVKKGNKAILDLVNDGFSRITKAEYRTIDDRWLGARQFVDFNRVIPYLGAGSAIALIIIATLVVFNRTLQSRVKLRTTELEEALTNLGISESQFRSSIEFLPIPISIADVDGNILMVNHQFTEHYGYTAEDIPTVSAWMTRAYPDQSHLEKVSALWEMDVKYAMVNQTKTPPREYQVTGKDGRLHDVEITMYPTGKLWVASFFEITERKLVEENLRSTTASLETLIRVSPLGILVVDLQDHVLVWNSSLERIFGWKAEEVLGLPNPIIPPSKKSEYESLVKQVVEGSSFVNLETTRTGKDGTEIEVSISSAPVYDANGKLNGRMAIINEVTEQKLAEKRLRDSESRYRTLFEDSPIMLLEEDFSAVKKYIDELKEKGVTDFREYFAAHPEAIQHCTELVRFVNVNKATLNWYGMEDSTKFHQTLGQIFGSKDYGSFKEELLALIEGRNGYYLSVSRETRSEKSIHLIINGRIMPGFEDSWERVLVSILDITERRIAEKRLSEQLQQIQLLRTIDQAIISSTDLKANLKLIIQKIIEQLRVDASDVLLLDPATQTLNFTAGQGFKTRALQFTRLRIGEGAAGQAAQERRMIHIADVQNLDENPKLSESIRNEGFVVYFGIPLIAKNDLLGVLEIFHRSPLDPDADWYSFLETLAGQASISIDSATLFFNLQKSNIELQQAYDATLEGWSHALDLRDEETEGHTRRVTEMAVRLARAMRLNEEETLQIRRGALLHDIGKMGIPDSILLKPSKLTDEEWVIMRKHPIYAYQMLSRIGYLKAALDIPYCHHEKWDGSGYPRGLKGEEIPIAARIFAIADVWDALSFDRPYRNAWEKKRVIQYIKDESGKHFDPNIAEIFLSLINPVGE